MKTRRILAASTAALLAFGTTAAYVASAADVTEVAVTTGVTADQTLSAVTVANGTTSLPVKVTLTGYTGVTEGTDVSSDVINTKKVEGTLATGDILTVNADLSGLTAGTQGNATATYKITVNKDDSSGVEWKTVTVTIPVTIGTASGDKTDYTAANAPNRIDIGGTATVIGPAVAESDTHNAVPAYSGGDVANDLTSGLNAKLKKDDAKKLKGVWAVKGEFVEVPENDDEKVAVDEDEIKNLGLSDENKKILAKTATSKVKIAKITVGKDGKTSTTITKPLTITVKNTFAGAKVYHVNSDGSLTLLKSDTTEAFDDGKKETTFSTTQFSPFIITTATLDAKAASTADTSSAAAATSSGTASTNPNTGIALAIAPVVLAAGAVAVVALKKKH